MAIETVTIPKERVQLANNALFEITEVSQLLRQFIAENDQTGSTQHVARGMLARIQLLSEAVTECLEEHDHERWPDDRIHEVVECRKRGQVNAQEAAHA